MPHRRRIGLAVFFAVAFAVPWFGWTLIDNAALSLWLFPLCVSAAGFAAAWAEGGRTGLGEFCRRTCRVRGAMRWTLLAALIAPALGLAYLLATGTSLAALRPAYEAGLATTLAAAVVTGPLAEEFGWRGYLQHRLLDRLSPLATALCIGAVWSLWHVPLFGEAVFGSVASSLRYLGYLSVWSVFMVYLVRRGGGSVWPAVAFHWAANVHADLLAVLLPSVDGSLLPGGSKGLGLYLLLAALFVALRWRFFAGRSAAPHLIERAPLAATAAAER